MYTAVNRAKMYACRKITRISNRLIAKPKTTVNPDRAVHPFSCQKKKFVAEKRRTRMMCPARKFAMRRIARVTGRRMNVEKNSIGTTSKCSSGGKFGITTEERMNFPKP